MRASIDLDAGLRRCSDMLAFLVAPLLATAVTVGEPARPLSVSQLLNAPEGASAGLAAVRGKAVVLEFWATWCAPCVAQIPRWNAMAQRYGDRRIQFIAVASEDVELINDFLLQHPMSGWVATDSGGKTFATYGVESVPMTVLIDAKGIVRAVTSLDHVTDADLDRLIERGDVQPLAAPSPG